MNQEKSLYQEVERMTLSYRIIKHHQVDMKVNPVDIPIISTERFMKLAERNHMDPEREDEFKNIKSQVDKMREEAEKQAESIVEQANKQAQTIKRQAQEKGYQEGFEKGQGKGYQEGYEKALQDVKSIKEEARKLLMNAHKESRQYIENIREEIIELAITMAKRILYRQIDTKEESIIEIVKSALHEAEERKQIIIRCCSSSISILKSHLDEFKKICPNAYFTFLEDNALEKYGCVIETEEQVMDLEIDQQLKNIKTALLEMREKNEL